jgi:hypothetical protein
VIPLEVPLRVKVNAGMPARVVFSVLTTLYGIVELFNKSFVRTVLTSSRLGLMPDMFEEFKITFAATPPGGENVTINPLPSVTFHPEGY